MDAWWWVLIGAVGGYFVNMFQPEIKSWLMGLFPKLVERRYQAARRGDVGARKWCRRWMPKARREELMEAAQRADDPVELWRVMVACHPEMSVEAPVPEQEEDRFAGPA